MTITTTKAVRNSASSTYKAARKGATGIGKAVKRDVRNAKRDVKRYQIRKRCNSEVADAKAKWDGMNPETKTAVKAAGGAAVLAMGCYVALAVIGD